MTALPFADSLAFRACRLGLGPSARRGAREGLAFSGSAPAKAATGCRAWGTLLEVPPGTAHRSRYFAASYFRK